MAKKKSGIQSAKGRGKIDAPSVKNPTPSPAKGRGNISNFDYTKGIKWTPKKIIIASSIVSVPYLATIIGTYIIGAKIVTAVLIGLGLLCVVTFFLLQWIEKNL